MFKIKTIVFGLNFNANIMAYYNCTISANRILQQNKQTKYCMSKNKLSGLRLMKLLILKKALLFLNTFLIAKKSVDLIYAIKLRKKRTIYHAFIYSIT